MSNQLVISKPGGDVTLPLDYAEALALVREQARKIGSPADGYRLKIRGGWQGEIRHDLAATMDKWGELAKEHDRKGDVIVLAPQGHPYAIVARWVEPAAPPVKDTSGNNDVDIIYTDWHARYPHSRNAGICVYKSTNGVMSQHCRWTDSNNEPGTGANASDEFLASTAEMLDAAYESVRLGKRFAATKGDDGIPLGRMIITNKIWDPFQDWHAYTGIYHLHNHMEGRWWLISGSATQC